MRQMDRDPAGGKLFDRPGDPHALSKVKSHGMH